MVVQRIEWVSQSICELQEKRVYAFMLKPLIKASSTQRENAASLSEEQFCARLGKLLGAHLLQGQRWQVKGHINTTAEAEKLLEGEQWRKGITNVRCTCEVPTGHKEAWLKACYLTCVPALFVRVREYIVHEGIWCTPTESKGNYC